GCAISRRASIASGASKRHAAICQRPWQRMRESRHHARCGWRVGPTDSGKADLASSVYLVGNTICGLAIHRPNIKRAFFYRRGAYAVARGLSILGELEETGPLPPW